MSIFSLQEVKAEQVNNVANNNFASWSEGATYGYFYGGETAIPNTVCTISRIDLSNEVVSLPAKNLTTAFYGSSAVESPTYAYIAGGSATSPTSSNSISRLDFTTETTSLPGNNLISGRTYLSGHTSSINALYAYFAGGLVGLVSYSSLYRLEFSSETVSSLTNMPAERYAQFNNNSELYGYLIAGHSPGTNRTSTVARLDFSSQLVSTIPTLLPSTRSFGAGISGKLFGYSLGGALPAPALSSEVSRLDFSNDTMISISNMPGTTSNSREGISNFSYGYFAAGAIAAPQATGSSQINRIDLSTELSTVSSIGLPDIVINKVSFTGSSSLTNAYNKTYGYFAAGWRPGVTSTITRIDFSTQTTNDLTNFLSQSINRNTAASSTLCGYVAGTTTLTNIYRLDYSNETTSTPTQTKLSIARASMAATSNNFYGYFCGGYNSPTTVFSIIDRLDFSTEVVSVPSVKLSIRNGSGAFSNDKYGYFGYGTDTAAAPQVSRSNLDRLDFSTEVVSNPGINLPIARCDVSATSNNLFGYYGGGGDFLSTPTYTSIITRLDFSTEIATNTTPHPTQRTAPAALSSSSAAFFGGGWAPTSSGISSVNRLDFSTESMLISPPIIVARGFLSGMSNSN